MTSHDEAEFDDAAHDVLRGLLADARVDTPVPPDVAARLDATLAELRAEREADLVVVPLRRRSRFGPRLLAAAAVVVVAGGVALGLQQTSDDDSRTTASDSSASARSQSRPEVAAGGGAVSDSAGDDAGDAADAPAAGALSSASVPAFTSAGFADQAAALVAPAPAESITPQSGEVDQLDGGLGSVDERATPTPAPAQDLQRSASGYVAGSKSLKGCSGPADAEGTVTRITFDGRPAALVVGPAKDGARIVEAWSCNGRTKLAGTTVQN